MILHNNNLTILPDEIANLVNLKVLCISNNNFEEVPDQLLNLESITHIDLMGNNIKMKSYVKLLPLLMPDKNGEVKITELSLTRKSIQKVPVYSSSAAAWSPELEERILSHDLTFTHPDRKDGTYPLKTLVAKLKIIHNNMFKETSNAIVNTFTSQNGLYSVRGRPERLIAEYSMGERYPSNELMSKIEEQQKSSRKSGGLKTKTKKRKKKKNNSRRKR